jgi:hypothetical protein
LIDKDIWAILAPKEVHRMAFAGTLLSKYSPSDRR